MPTLAAVAAASSQSSRFNRVSDCTSSSEEPAFTHTTIGTVVITEGETLATIMVTAVAALPISERVVTG